MRSPSGWAAVLLWIATQQGDLQMQTACEDMKAAIDAETNPEKKAALEAEYQQKCVAPDAQRSGGNGPGPKNPHG